MTEYLTRWRAEFEQAIDGSLYGIDYLDRLIRNGLAQCWFGDNACIVTQIKDYPKARVIHGLVAAGDLQEIVETLIPRAEAWGKMAGCSMAIIESREGWARALKQHGWEPHQVALRKGL
jgi:hypothetical protein